ncbi:hypothetical protein TcWFU_009885 [Taenia crassiceps]|uniref:Uncharacterized protein n=1 Tax=Taenia crassiceps TaxID=6207 RepID=A0ABR4QTY8_9CEST
MEFFKWIWEIKENIPTKEHKWIILIPVGAYLAYRIIRKWHTESQLPPGPTGWPWLGCTSCLGEDAFNKVQLICEKYGPVTSFRICGKLIVILSDEETIKEAALKRRTLMGRHTMLTNHLLAKGYGISNYDGENANCLRRIFVGAIHRILPNRTANAKSENTMPSRDAFITQVERHSPSLIEDKLDTECLELANYLRRKGGEPVKISRILRRLVWRVVWKAAFGTDCTLDDATVTQLLHCVAENNSKNGPFQFKQMLPNFWSVLLMRSKVARRMLGVDDIWKRYERLTSVLNQAVAEHRSSQNRTKNCLISSFLDDDENTTSEADANRLAFEIMAAGVDTTTLTLVWSCYAIATARLKLRSTENFTESHLEVVHRLASVVPMALPHYARFDSHVGGYLIPKGSVVFFNLFAVHQSQLKRLGQTNKGCPYTASSSMKHKMYLCESAMPFSLGSRACPGFMFATRVITRIMSCIIANFRIEACQDEDNPNSAAISGDYELFYGCKISVAKMSAPFQCSLPDPGRSESKGSEAVETNNDDLSPLRDSGTKLDTTHVTIQLPESMQGNSISQQKMQELIVHLSQSGQLKDDGKIIIEVKGTQEKSKERSSEGNSDETSAQQSVCSLRAPQTHSIKYVTVQQASGASGSSNLQKTAFIKTANGSIQSKSDTHNQSASTQGQTEHKSLGTPGTYHILTSTNGQHLQQSSQAQQPAYILIPATQQAQPISVAPLNSPSTASSSTPIRVVNQGGQHIILQHANNSSATSTPISSFSLKTASMLKDGERSVVVLQQQHQNPAPIVPVRPFVQQHNNRLPPAPPAIAAAATSATFSTNTSTSSVRVSRGGSLGSSGKESSWQQYVKQFEKLGPCPICGDKISGYHYGIFCCESCKGFFKRTVQNSKRYACHMATPSSLCDITATSRKKCPACRFVKCLEKGMRMEAIRSDRTRGGRSMYPGSRYLRQLAARASGGGEVKCELKGTSAGGVSTLPAIAPLPNAGVSTTTSATSEPFSKIDGVHIMSLGVSGGVAYEIPASEDVGGGVYLDPAVLEDTGGSGPASSSAFHDESIYRLPVRNQENIDMPKILREIIKVEESVESEPEERLDFDSTDASQIGISTLPSNVTEEEAAVYRALLNLADQRLYRIVRWSRALPVFSNLDTDDQILLLQNCWADLLCLDCCWKSLPTPTEIRLTSTKCINLDAAREMGAEGLVDSLLRLTQDLKRLRFGLIDFACLKVFLLMQGELVNLKAVRQVKQFQECVSQLLMDYNATSCADVPNKFTELLVRIPELQRTSAMARELLVDKDLSPYLSANSLLMELLRSDFHRQPGNLVPPTSVGPVAMDTSGQATTFLASQHRTEDDVDERHRGVFQTGDTMSAEASSYSTSGPL